MLKKIVSRLSLTPVSNIQVEFERKHDMRACVYIYICMCHRVVIFLWLVFHVDTQTFRVKRIPTGVRNRLNATNWHFLPTHRSMLLYTRKLDYTQRQRDNAAASLVFRRQPYFTP